MQFIDRDNENPSINPPPLFGRGLSQGILIILGLVLGVIVAFLISQNAWMYAGALALSVPLVLLVVTNPFTGLILWLLLMPFVSIMPDASIVYWAIYRILTPVILILAVLSRKVRVRERPFTQLGLTELAMGALILIVPASILLSTGNSNQALIHYSDRILLPFLMYLAIRLLTPRDRELHQLQWAALFIVISQALIGFLSWFAPQVLPPVWRHLQGARTTGSLMDADLYSAMIIFSVVLLIQGGINRKSGMVRFLFFAASGVGAICVFMSLERAAWLGGVLVIIGLIFLFRKIMFRLIFIGSIAMLILGTGVLSIHFSLSTDRFSDPGPIYDRIVVFDAMFQMFQIKPVLGWGYDTLDQNIQHFYRRVGEAAITRGIITSHNTYLTILTELGLVGFMLYMFPVIWWFILTLRVWRRMPKEGLWSRSLVAALWLSLLFDFTVSNFIDMRWFPIGLTHWWMTLGLIANMVFPYLKGQRPASSASNLCVQI